MHWFPIDQSARFLSDEAELIALTNPSLSCSLEDLKSALNQSSSEGDLAEEDSDLAFDEALETRVADAAEEIDRRSAIIGEGYPFSFNGTVVTASNAWDDEALAYVFLLLMSAEGLPGLDNGRRLFEQVVTAALGQYLTGESLRFGFPHRTPVPSHPDDAVNYLAEQIGQRRIFTRQVRKNEKDMGVDAVAWKRFSDGLPTKVVLLANCSTGANWSSKLGELSIEKWKRMIDFGCDPVQVFAVPWIPSPEDWLNIVDFGNMVLDRARTASLLAGWDATATIRTWCKSRLKDVTPS